LSFSHQAALPKPSRPGRSEIATLSVRQLQTQKTKHGGSHMAVAVPSPPVNNAFLHAVNKQNLTFTAS
jgi:hypothetical protein